MKVRIENMKEGLLRGKGPYEAYGVSLDPEGKYAVAELFRNELFVALTVTSRDEEMLTGEYAGHFSFDNDIPTLLCFSVDWTYIGYGFCKLVLWAPEEIGGIHSGTVRRFWFDRALYRARYEELNGVPPKRKDR